MSGNIEQAEALYKGGKIDRWSYETYVLFMRDELAARYLGNSIDSVLMEEPPPMGEHVYARQDGRISIWRDINKAVIGINNLILGRNYDGTPRTLEQ